MTLENALLAAIAALVSVVTLLWRENKAKDRKLEAALLRTASEQKARNKDSDLFLTTLAQLQRKFSVRPPPDRVTPSETPERMPLPPYSPPSVTMNPTRKSPR